MGESAAVIVAGGVDRPGVLDELSQFLMECGGNITDIRSINLRGRFSLMILVRGTELAIDKIREGLLALKNSGIAAEMHPSSGETEVATFPYVFIARGTDQAGVLHRISHLLRVLNINIENIETKVKPAGPFEIRLTLAIPRETPITMVKDYLTYLCNEIHITGELKEA